MTATGRPSAFLTPAHTQTILRIAGEYQLSHRALSVRVFAYRRAIGQISRRGQRYCLGIHPCVLEGPDDIFPSLLRCLFSRIRNQAPTPSDQEKISTFSREIARNPACRSSRKHPVQPPQGDFWDLKQVYQRVNREYFGGDAPDVIIGWSRHPSFRRLATWYDDSRTVTVSRLMDHPLVPAHFIEFLVYHELLHALLPPRRTTKQVIHHHTAFRNLERAFPRYREAMVFQRWLSLPRNRRRLQQSMG